MWVAERRRANNVVAKCPADVFMLCEFWQLNLHNVCAIECKIFCEVYLCGVANANEVNNPVPAG
jgi:hypothetical protein